MEEQRRFERRFWYIPVFAFAGIAVIATIIVTIVMVSGHHNIGIIGQEESSEYIASTTESYVGLVPEAGALKVRGTTLVDQKGTPFQLRGVSTHGIAWYPDYVNYEAFKTLRDNFGINLIRLAMYTGENQGYCKDGNKSNIETILDEGVEYASALGMYVIIDWHILSEKNPNSLKSEAMDFFSRMAKRYADYTNVIYEICNEPNGVKWKDVKDYADAVIPCIRQYDQDAIIIVGTPTWCQDIDAVASNPLADSNRYNVMYSCHFYASTHKQQNRKKLESALKNGTPVFLSEFSICEASGDGKIDYDSADAWFDLIDRYNLSYAAWNLSNKAEASALLRSTCTSLSNWSDADYSDTARWILNKAKEGFNGFEGADELAPNIGDKNSGSVQDLTFTHTIRKTKGWIESHSQGYTLNLYVENPSAHAVGNWKIRIRMPDDAMVFQDPWGCNASIVDGYLILSGYDYCETIRSGERKNFGVNILSTFEFADVVIEPVDEEGDR